MQNNQPKERHATERYTLIPRTLNFIFRQSHLLLIKGAPSKTIHPNLYNGIGGHVERRETVAEAALREIREETGLATVTNLHLRGTITIDVSDQTGIILFIFTGTTTDTTIHSSPEGEPQWISVQAISSLPCAPDLPAILARIENMQDAEPPFHIHYPTHALLNSHPTQL